VAGLETGYIETVVVAVDILLPVPTIKALTVSPALAVIGKALRPWQPSEDKRKMPATIIQICCSMMFSPPTEFYSFMDNKKLFEILLYHFLKTGQAPY